jgi:eukaryotic-like serine/threonine-protein kinase
VCGLPLRSMFRARRTTPAFEPDLGRRSVGNNFGMAGETLGGRYRLGERVGSGGMSEVWSAHDLELDRRVALKLLAADADRVRFEREAKAAAGLSHPHICRLFDFGEAEGRPYIVLELLPGGSLDDRLSDGHPLPDDETARIATELASGLAYAHSHGVLHRDVKPTNILFDSEGHVKIADFGIARILDAPTLTEAGTLLGTAPYISPEQSRGQPVTPATDVYAFGVVLYQMLTGRPPFEGHSALDVAAMHATREPPPIESIRSAAPPRLASLAGAALAKRPEDRPPDGNALLAALEEPQTSHAVTAEPATQVLPARRVRRIGARELAAAGVLLALAVAGAAVAMLAMPEASQAPVTGVKPPATTGTRATTAGATTLAPSTTARASTRARTSTAASPPPAAPTPARTATQTPTTAPVTTFPTTTDVTTTGPTTETTPTTTTTTTEPTPTTTTETTPGGFKS